MDPTATWEAMQREPVAENCGQAMEHAGELLRWLQRDGFPPLTGSKDLPYDWHRTVAEAGANYVLCAGARTSIDKATEQEDVATDGP